MKSSRGITRALALAVAMLTIGFGSDSVAHVSAAAASGTWSYTANNLQVGRTHFRATTLPNGPILIEGGATGDGGNGPSTSESELYNPATNSWTVTGSMNVARAGHTATLLQNGKVLVAAGYPETNAAEIYDPATGTWSGTGSLSDSPNRHTATLLSDGRVLVAGGWQFGCQITRTELYDPATGTWSASGSMLTPRADHVAVRLKNNKVLIAGGDNDCPHERFTAAELYDPSTGTFAATGSMNVARSNFSATLLPDGRVLAVGGLSGLGQTVSNSDQNVASAEIYDPATGTWSLVSNMARPRNFALGDGALLLHDGTVLVAGGDGWNPVNDGVTTSEVFNPVTGSWSPPVAFNAGRFTPASTLLSDGRALVVSGDVIYPIGATMLSAEVYTPAVQVPTSPTITGISPVTGSITGGTSITITGTGFVPGATVTIGGIGANNVAVNGTGTSITATTAAHAAGAVSVVVTNPDGKSATLSNAYAYAPPGKASSQPLLMLVAGIMGPGEIGCTNADKRAQDAFQYIIKDVLKPAHYQGTMAYFNYGDYQDTGLQKPDGLSVCWDGRGYPGQYQYDAGDNHKQLKDSALQMEVQLERQASSLHPSRVDLIAHSQGGAVSLLWAQMYGKTFNDRFHLPVNIVTLDSPVMGCTSIPCFGWNNVVMQVPSVQDMQNPDIIERMLAARGSPTLHYDAVTTVTVFSAANGLPGDPLVGDVIVTYRSAHPSDLDGQSRTIGANTVPRTLDIHECVSWTAKPADTYCHMSVLADPDVESWTRKIIVS